MELRGALQTAEMDVLVSGRDTIALRPDTFCSDVGELSAALAGLDTDALIASLGQLGTARLLEGLEISGLYAEWLDQTRSALDQSVASGVLRHVERLVQMQTWTKVRDLAEAYLRRDPLDESVVAAAMRADGALGAASSARRRFQTFKTALAKEFGAKPDATVREALSALEAPADGETSFVRADDRPSIAVLPFVNMSNDREQEFLADGLTEDIITGLSLSRMLFVIASNSSFSYKGSAVSVRDVGRELGVRNVLEGSVRRMGDKLRVTAKLIDADTASHLWGQTLDRPLADLFSVQDEITDGIVAALTAHLTHAVTPEVSKARPESLEAWELFGRARAHIIANLDADGRRTAEQLLRTAVEKDPNYAKAWVYLGCMIAFRWLVEPGTSPSANRAEAQACVERGAKLAPNDPDVLANQGNFFIYIGKPKDALPFLEQAIHLNPNEMHYRVNLARALVRRDRADEAVGEMETVPRLSPRDPFAPLYALDMATIQFGLGRYKEAEVWAGRALAGGARSFPTRLTLGIALAAQGRVEEAQEIVRQAVHISPEITLASREYIYRNAGWEESVLAEHLTRLAIAWPPEFR